MVWLRETTAFLQCTTEVGTDKNRTMAEHTDKPKEQHVDPWTAVAAEGENKIDYDKLISAFFDVYDHV